MTGLYIAATGMVAQNQKLSVVANNMANTVTNGFKSEEATFKTYYDANSIRHDRDNNTNLGAYSDEVYVDDITTNYSAGMITSSTSMYDLALEDSSPDGDTSFFMVTKNGQQYLTRNGSFKVDAEGTLCLANGGIAMNTRGQKITIPEGIKVSINQSGVISNADTQEVIDQMQIKTVAGENLGYIQQEGNGYMTVRSYDQLMENYGSMENLIDLFGKNETVKKMYKNIETLQEIQRTGQVNVLEDFSGNVRQNALEGSNVQMDEQMVELINAQKAIQANSKAFTSMDKLFEVASNGLKK